jgi:uncharacterized protein YgiB involved in biofilm formation
MTTAPKTLRRSRYVTTLMMGAAATALVACEQQQTVETDVTVYPTVEDCTRDFDANACEQAANTAVAEHLQTAPRFNTAEECAQAGFENCAAAPQQAGQQSGTGSFMPFLMGYMMARAFSPGMAPGAGATPGSSWSKPVYGDRNGFLYSGNRGVGQMAPGQALGRSTGPLNMRTAVTPTGQFAGRTVTRGGFGATGSRFSAGS